MSTIEDSEEANTLPRITTGNTQLDAILGGGFPANSINILMGEPGSGKTILAEHLVFANARTAGRPIVYLTTLSEPLDKVVRYLQSFTFFDADKLATGAVAYESLGTELEADGIAALVPKLEEIIKTRSPRIVVIDSFKAIHDVSPSLPAMRRMLYQLSGLLTAYETTAFLLGEYSDDQVSVFPEFAVADGMVELARKKLGTRDERYLRVLKLRGSNYQEGLHAFRINTNGLDVFPRLTSPVLPLSYPVHEARLSTGIAGLDKMLDGGLWAGGAILVEGESGAGKTTLALQFILEGLKHGEPGLYVNFQENPIQLARTIQSLGIDLEEAKRQGLHLLYASPVELQIDSILVTLFRTIEERDIKRVAVDAVGDLVGAATDLTRLYNYLYALVQHFVVRRIASLMTLETRPGRESMVGPISVQSDVIVRLKLDRRGDTTRRTLQVVKARGTNHDLDVKELCITSSGIDVS